HFRRRGLAPLARGGARVACAPRSPASARRRVPVLRRALRGGNRRRARRLDPDGPARLDAREGMASRGDGAAASCARRSAPRPGVSGAPDPRTEADRILAGALDLPAQERGPYLDRLCRQDMALRARVERLLAAAESESELLPPGGVLI